MTNNSMPLQIGIETARKELRIAVASVQRKTNMPSFLMEMILSDIKTELANDEKAEMLALMAREEEKQKNDHTAE